MPREKWVTLLTTNDEITANLKQGLLEQVGITCVIEPSVYRPRSVAPLYSEFKLNVPAKDADLGRKVLSDLRALEE